ncbi:MAG TPA: GNAT family N-acetyltransferase [Micropepsaceae bacterium]|nr:GNAT family N-acetyltransferase [Micropepsaceae bacterium]
MKRAGGRPRELRATVTFLAMENRSTVTPPPPPLLKTALLKCENPAVHFYRYLYDTVGRPWYWIERRQWSDDRLKAHLANEKVALYALYLGGVPGGMAELDFRERSVGQLSYFGLMPEFIGRRIGPWFLHQIVELCWAEPVSRLLVNTCTLDYKKALVTYQRAGFIPYARTERTVVVPRDYPEMPERRE